MTVAMRDIFEKPVDRSIDGVIKADDEASLRTELDEYVITGEIGQRLELFLDAYNNYRTANGVWISGFFGSGKSHLLKMLALLLENREVDGVRAFDIFAEKLKDEPMLAGALRKAVSVPSKSILFNIDQKADVISKNDVDALLSVFQKVFDEMCGYYGKQPHIAQFERQLDERGQFDAFKAAFLALSGKSWETRGREEALLEGRNIAAAFAQATGTDAADAKDILSHYRKDTRVSIEDFANTVKTWIDRQAPNFRLNFFVDEVGQYIADNVKLMTNLQTIAESLNTKCKGQAWIIVTAQQAITEVVGDMTARQKNDFSKIQARFANRMPLNSADVAEVIQRRLLSKTDAAQIMLGNLHDREENNLKTLFDFADGSIRLKNYRDRGHFVASYPFPPYQYTLFQMAITSLSQHNAFEGKHSSVGERSMLGVFQEVAKALADCPVGGLATFDLMFEGIRTALKSSVQQSIQIAERNLDDPFAVRVLKALFLVKYVKEFKPTVRNISILLLSEFEADQAGQRRKIEDALALLERETYIQRNGEVYEFLTNEEKDVEAEIKALDVDPTEISKELETLAFDTILKHRKIKHLTTGYEYPFSRRLDDHLLGREYELAINIISPFNDDAASPDAVRMRNLGREELAIVLQPDVRFIRDLTLFRQTDKFIRQSRSGSPQPGRDRIILEKGEQNGRRAKDLELRLRKLMATARLFVRGDELDIGGDEPQERTVKAFQALVDKVYVNLPMLRGVNYVESDIAKAASPSSTLFGEAGTGLSDLDAKINEHFAGFVVRKDLVKAVKGNAIVPTYVLEYLLGQYCATDDEASIQTGIETVKDILRKHYVHRSEAGLIQSTIKEKGRYKVIDQVSVALNEKTDSYEAVFDNLGIKKVAVDSGTVKAHPKLLVTGVWCIADVQYEFSEDARISPWILETIKPIQIAKVDYDQYRELRSAFTTDEWIDLLMQSIGFKPEAFGRRSKLLQLLRLIPYVERNYNLIELGPKGTGKSHIYSEFSPHGQLISGGEVTIPKLFVNNSNGRIGLVGYWDVVAFDEFAGREKTANKALVDIMKNYMANKSFSRGVNPMGAEASFSFVGNTDHNVPFMLKNSDLFEALPSQFHGSAFIDRLHAYLPGWEIDVIRGEMFTKGYGFIVDYLAEILRHLRSEDFSNRPDQYFKVSGKISTRDRDAIYKTMSGLLKLIFPDGSQTVAEVEELLQLAMESRKRVKDQLARIDSTYPEVDFHYVGSDGTKNRVTTVEEEEYPQFYNLKPALEGRTGIRCRCRVRRQHRQAGTGDPAAHRTRRPNGRRRETQG